MANMLETLSNQMPVANAQRQKQQKAATDFQLKQAVAAAPVSSNINTVTPGLGQAAAQQIGQAQVTDAKQNLQTQQALGNTALQQKATDISTRLTNLQQSTTKQGMNADAEFSRLDAQAKKDMFDNRMAFQSDAMGRQFMTERQIQDYMVSHAKDQQDYQNYVANAEAAYNVKAQAMESAYRKVANELEFQNKLSNERKDNALIVKLAEAKASLEKKLREEADRKAARHARFQAGGQMVGTVVGGVIGAIYGGGPAGATVGAAAGGQVGGAVGGGVASATE